MKTLKELRGNLDLHPTELASSVKYFASFNIDWDVYLPSIGKNLQRGLVWTLEQKRELINSVLIGRHIPHCAAINIVNPKDRKTDIYQIIDGKQRLSTLIGFTKKEFKIEIDGLEYFIDELPNEYQIACTNYYFRYYLVNEPYDTPITDRQKIEWFKFINFAGTKQDAEHLKSLEI